MKSIEFSEEHLGNMSEIAQELFNDENDPTSFGYKRKLNRPKIYWLKILLFSLISTTIFILSFYITYTLSNSALLSCILSCLLLIIFLLANCKRIIICIIKIYQRYAPTSLREKCRFEPSCSEYMILAIEKYGFIKGVKKGINRLKRCNINNGGFDYP